MKQLIGLFLVIFLSIAAAEMVMGALLTMLYTPSVYASETVAIANIFKYTISALTVTAVLAIVYKINRALRI